MPEPQSRTPALEELSLGADQKGAGINRGSLTPPPEDDVPAPLAQLEELWFEEDLYAHRRAFALGGRAKVPRQQLLGRDYETWFTDEQMRPSLIVNYGAETGNWHRYDEREKKWLGRPWSRGAPLYIEHNRGRVEHLIRAVTGIEVPITPMRPGTDEPLRWSATFGPHGTLAQFHYLTRPALRVLGTTNICRMLRGKRGGRSITEDELRKQCGKNPAYAHAIKRIGRLYVSDIASLRWLDAQRQQNESLAGKKAGRARKPR